MYFPNLYIVESVFLQLFFFFFWLQCQPRGMWDISDETRSPCLGNGESSHPVEWVHFTGPPGKSSAAFKCGWLHDCHLCHILFSFKTLFLSIHTKKSSVVSNVFPLDQRSANFFWKDPDRKYFRLCRQYSLLRLKC